MNNLSMDMGKKRIRINILFAIASLIIPSLCNAAPPETGTFTIPEVTITNAQIKSIIALRVQYAICMGHLPPEYNFYLDYGPVVIGKKHVENKYSLMIDLDKTEGIPWYTWDSYCIIDGYRCFMNKYFTECFTKPTYPQKQKPFKYSFETERNDKTAGSVHEWRYDMLLEKDGNYKIIYSRETTPIYSWQQHYMQNYDRIKEMSSYYECD